MIEKERLRQIIFVNTNHEIKSVNIKYQRSSMMILLI